MSDAAVVSIVIPVYNEVESLPLLIRELSRLGTSKWGDEFEFVLVDDCSTDRSWEILRDWSSEDSRVTLVQLAGNSGSPKATRAGHEVAAGDVMIALPADLQEGLDLVDACLDKWHSNHRIVMMVPKTKRVYENRFDALCADAFYWLLKLNSRIHGDLSVRATAKLLDRQVAKDYCRHAASGELRTPYVLRNRFPYDVVYYDVKPRSAGTSKWSFQKKIALMVNLLVDSSARWLSPWRLAFVGFAIYTVLRLSTASIFSSQAHLRAASDIGLAGFVFLVLSVVGVYVERVHQAVRSGSPYLIRQIVRGHHRIDQDNDEIEKDYDRPRASVVKSDAFADD